MPINLSDTLKNLKFMKSKDKPKVDDKNKNFSYYACKNLFTENIIRNENKESKRLK